MKDNFSKRQVALTSNDVIPIFDALSITSVDNVGLTSRGVAYVLDIKSGDPNTNIDLDLHILGLSLQPTIQAGSPPVLELQLLGSGSGESSGLPKVIRYEQFVGILIDETKKLYEEA